MTTWNLHPAVQYTHGTQVVVDICTTSGGADVMLRHHLDNGRHDAELVTVQVTGDGERDHYVVDCDIAGCRAADIRPVQEGELLACGSCRAQRRLS